MEDKVVKGTASYAGDVEPILPDGWKEGDTLVPESTDDPDQILADGQEEDLLAGLEDGDAKAAPADPTKVKSSEAEVTDAGATQQTDTPDGEPKTEARTPRKLTLKVNHKEEEIDLDAMSDEELTALLQKGRAFDAMKDAENKRTFRQVYQEQIDAGMTEAAARMIAKDAAEGHTYALTDEEEQPKAPTLVAEPEHEAPKTRDLRAEVEQLRALYPEVKEFPDEVAKAVSQGIPVLTAYLAYREKQSTKTAASLQKENTVLKQNAARTAKAPVTGVTGGGSTTQKAQSVFDKAFDAGFNW